MFRDGIRRILETEPGIEVAAEASDGQAALDVLAALPIDILVLDLSLPKVSGTEVLRRLTATGIPVRVVVLTMYPADRLALHLIELGAGAYIDKNADAYELVQAIRAVASGGTYITESLRAQASSRTDGLSRAPHEQLTTREYQVFMQLIHGKTVSETSYELDLKVNTISTYVARIKTKLGVGSVGEILVYAHRMGLMD